MEFIAVFFLLLFVLSVIGIFGFLVFTLFKNGILEPLLEYIDVSKGLSSEQKLILDNGFPYYKQLSISDKKEFEKRLKYFIRDKEFIAKSMPEVTEEMKILVGASAVQLTFGYHPLKFPHFTKIVLFPGRFYAKGSNKQRKGEVNTVGGLIILSWKDFIKDYKLNDGYNVGLHEMAHAFKVEDLISDEYSFIKENDLTHFYEVSEEEFLNIRNGKESFIRSYGGTNQEEFFAVAVEQFFEQPKEFKERLPEIYNALSRILNQDPAFSLS